MLLIVSIICITLGITTALANNYYNYDNNIQPITTNTNTQPTTTTTDQGLEITDNTNIYCDSQGNLTQTGEIILKNTNTTDYIDITKIEFLDTTSTYTGTDYGTYTIKDADNKINLSGTLGNCTTTNSYYMTPNEEITLNISYDTVFNKLYELIHATTINNKFADLQVTHKKSEAYAVVRDSSTSNSNDINDLLEFRYDGQRDNYNLTFDCANTGTSSPGWAPYIGGTSDPSNNTVTQVNFTDNFINVKPTSCYKWFAGYNSTTTGCQPLIINFNNLTNLNTSECITMYAMFSSCTNITTLNISNFDTGKVTTMQAMFFKCKSLTTLDTTNFNTSKVTTMRDMFNNCSKLTNLDVSKFNMSLVNDIAYMFTNCSGLTSLDVSNWDTSNITNMCDTFGQCSNLSTLNVSKWDTSKVTTLECTFFACNKLVNLDVSNFNTDNLKTLRWTFNGCSSLTSLNVSKWNTSNVTSMESTFNYCKKLTTLDLSSFNTSNVTNMSSMFAGCSGLTSLDVSGFDTSQVTNMQGIFYTKTGKKDAALSSRHINCHSFISKIKPQAFLI